MFSRDRIDVQQNQDRFLAETGKILAVLDKMLSRDRIAEEWL
jgi:hypothetical protein